MPLHDRECEACGWSRSDCYQPRDTVYPCEQCNAPDTKRVYSRVSVIPDTFSTPLVDENMAKTTQVFYSRSERKAAMKRLGVHEAFRHVEFNHSDKSPHSVKWR